MDKQLLSKTLLSEEFSETLQTSSFTQKLSSPKALQKPFGQAASLKNSPLRRVSRNPSDKQLLSKTLLSEGFPETLRTSSFSQKLSSPKGFQKPFGQAASLKNSPLQRVSRNPSDKQLLSKTLLSEGFPETLRTSSFSQKLSSPKGFQKPFGQAASLKNSPLRRVSRNPSDKQLLSKTLLSEKPFGQAASLNNSPLRRVSRNPSDKQLLSKTPLSEGFPETLRTSSFSQKLSSPKGFQKPFGQAASLKNSPLRRVSRNPSDKQLLSKTLLSEGFPETLRTSSFSQNSPLRRLSRHPSDKPLLAKTLLSAGSPETLRTSSFSQQLSSPKGFQKPFGQAASLKNSPLRRVSRNPSDKQLLSKLSSPKGFQKPFGQAASLKNSPLRRVSRNPSDKQLLSKTLLSKGFPETLRTSSFSQKLSSSKGFKQLPTTLL